MSEKRGEEVVVSSTAARFRVIFPCFSSSLLVYPPFFSLISLACLTVVNLFLLLKFQQFIHKTKSYKQLKISSKDKRKRIIFEMNEFHL